ncbi:MAG: FAD-binding oxidoreductase [Chloroflexi bacterium]|nr:FAD-binding oxidoreductase [Chloroflexota bacterium]
MASSTVVVIGAGALGASTAYHLARKGAAVTLVDQFAPGSQTSPRAAGLTNTKAVNHELMARLTHEATEALACFEEEHGVDLQFHRSGSVKAAYTPDGEAHLLADLEMARSLGIPVELISPADAVRLAPWFRPGAPRAVGYVPEDAYLEPSRVPAAYVELARRAGARVQAFTQVTGIETVAGRLTGVTTSNGGLPADAVVDAAGGWSRTVAARAGLRLPLVPVRHQLFITEPISGVVAGQPVVRFLESSVYVRPERGGLMLGGYEDTPLPFDPSAQASGFQMADLPLDLGVLRGLLGEIAEHVPALRDAPVRVHRGGTPTMTPDGYPILGAVPGLAGLFVASGCCVGGLSLSPAAGRALADLILDGASTPDLTPFSVERFRGWMDPAAIEVASLHHYARKYTR